MGYFVISYERNKKYLVAFAVWLLYCSDLYKALSRFSNWCSVICCIGFHFFYRRRMLGLPCDAHWWSVLCFYYTRLNTQMNKFTLRAIHICRGNVNREIKTSICGRYFDVYKISKNHLQIFLFEEGQFDQTRVKFGKGKRITGQPTHIGFIGYIPQTWIWDWRILNFSVGILLSWSNF